MKTFHVRSTHVYTYKENCNIIDIKNKMSKKRKKKVFNQVEFNFSKELIAYFESDVKPLKAGCLKFKAIFEEKSMSNQFNRMTITSACNRDLCQNRMLPNTIASEPLHGWRMSSNHF